MHANDNARSSGRPPANVVMIIGRVTADSFSPGFNLRAATAALRPKPPLRLVRDDSPKGG